MPALPIVIRLEQFADFSRLNLGDRALDLSWIHQFVSVTPTLLIPADTLEKVLITSHKLLKLQNILADDQLSHATKHKKISEFFLSLPVPQSLVTTIHAEYHEYFANQPVRLSSANAAIGTKLTEVQGAVNLLLAIKSIWCEQIQNTLKQTRWQLQLVPSGILVQSIPKSKVSGFVASHHLGGIHKSALVIQAQKTSDENIKQIEEYQVDVRSQAVIMRPDGVYAQKTAKINQLSLLSDSECRQLATLAAPVMRQRLHPLVLSWSLTEKGFVFYDPLQPNQETSHRPKKIARPATATKIFVTSNSITRMATSIALVDGVGPLTARYLVHSSGLHPLGALRHPSTQTVLKHNIRRALFELVSVKRDLTIFYAFYHASPSQRATLFLSESDQSDDPETSNLSGASFLLTFPQWFNFELQTLVEFLKQTPSNLDLVIPEVKTPEEVPQILKLIDKSGIKKLAKIGVWLEVATPATAQSLHLFPLDGVAGLLINLDELLLRSLCLNSATMRKESTRQLATAVAQDLLSTVSRQLLQHFNTQTISVVVSSSIIEEPIIKKIVSLGWQGISVQPDHILETRSMIQNAEKLVVEHKL